jgi:hypothetical protein
VVPPKDIFALGATFIVLINDLKDELNGWIFAKLK